MKIRKMLAGAVALALGLAVSTSVTARDLRVGLIVPGAHQWSQAAEAMGKELEERSGGRYTVTVFPAGQLGSEARMLQQLQTGALDMAFLTIAEMTNRIEDYSAFFAPYLVDDVEHASRLLQQDTAEQLLERLPREAGVVGLGYGIAAMRLVLNAFETNAVEDLDGRRMRITPFPPVRDFYRLLGAASTPMPLPDVYDALANRQVDGVDADMELVWTLRLHERAHTLLHSNHMMFPMVGLYSARLWQQLPPDDRELIAEVARKHLNGLFDKYAQVEADMLENVKGAGVNIKQVGPEFFGDKLDEWESTWQERTPILADLRKEAEATRQ